MTKAFVKAPAEAKAGEVIAIKVLIRHRMESGHRRDRKGAPIPRDIIHTFSATYDGEEVFRMELFPGIAANPYLEFRIRATRSGDLVCRWQDDGGESHSKAARISVT